MLEDLSGLASEAAACCVHAGLTSHAVEVFEQGRGVLLGQALDIRTDLTTLKAQHPDLAAQFTAACEQLEKFDEHSGRLVASPLGMEVTAADVRAEAAQRDVQRRRKTAEELDRVIAEIRTVQGFESFLRPLSVSDLAATAADGPVIVINVSQYGSHALILTSNGVLEPLPLDDLTPDSVYDHVIVFLAALEVIARDDTNAAAADQRLIAVLAWLWDVAVGPVLDRLGVNEPLGDESRPRLWWCPSGLLSFLPLHAAGHHQTRFDAFPKTVVDRVVSSYTPTIRALAYARRTRLEDSGPDMPDRPNRVVVVAMPQTPSASDLPGVDAEAALLRQLFPDRVSVLIGSEATHASVLAALPAARWAHFACHGFSDLTNPSASSLLLDDHLQRPFTVGDVVRLRLNDVDLAFLSACSTASPGRLADEAIHLASAFQLAGYRHVIGTLWRISDKHAVTLADDIYTVLAAVGTVNTAAVLHAASRRLRNRWMHMPSVWASHIHSGA